MRHNDSYFSVDPRSLAHCRYCHEPMYCIYDANLRDFCWECLVESEEQAAEAAKQILTEASGGWHP